VTYRDGVWFDISLDPAVVEVQASPMTASEWAKNSDRFQKDVFETAKFIGLEPHPDIGGGHIHIGLDSAFEQDSMLFRNFIVDFTNHPELARGVLSHDESNSPALADAENEIKEEFQKVIHYFDQGLIRRIEDLAHKIEVSVYHYNYDANSLDAHAKYQALSLSRVTDNSFKVFGNLKSEQRTVELRAIRAQTSFNDYLKQIKLFEARLRYLKTLDHPVEFIDPHRQFTRKKMEAFRRYVEEPGLKWDDYRTLAPRDFQNTQQFDVRVKPLSQEKLKKTETTLRESSRTLEL